MKYAAIALVKFLTEHGMSTITGPASTAVLTITPNSRKIKNTEARVAAPELV